jgi:hypothetical protein
VLFCVSIRVPNPPDPSFLHVCVLSLLNLLSLPVRFLGGTQENFPLITLHPSKDLGSLLSQREPRSSSSSSSSCSVPSAI